MPNPQGYNAFGGPMEHETPYGDVQKEKDLLSLAPLSQRSPTPMNAPRRAQRHATGQDSPRGEGAPAVPPTEPRVPSEDRIAGFWTAMAAEPGASDLVKMYAERAHRG